MELIRTDSVGKNFGATYALKEISINVNQGEIYGFIGLNGAGKTTLIRILLGMIRPTQGEVNLLGRKLTPNFSLWNDVGYLVEIPFSYPNLSVVENLKVYYHLRQLKDNKLIPNIIEKLRLSQYKDIKAQYLSLGNQQRLGLAKALMHNPKLLILDEPINGLDPEGIVEVRELLKELVSNGSTVFISSHILSEVFKVATRIGIIHEGELIKELTSKELSQQLIKKTIIVTDNNASAIKHLLDHQYQIVTNDNKEIEILTNEAIVHPEMISKLLAQQNIFLKRLYVETEDLENYFLRTIKINERENAATKG